MAEKKTSLTEQESKILNSILPNKFHKESWDMSHFYSSLRDNVKDYLHKLEYEDILKLKKQVEDKSSEKEKLLNSINAEKAAAIKVFNVSHKDAKLLGMVDVGSVKTFTSASSGNRLEGGAMQLIIEQAFDNAWKANNAQMKGLNEVKLEFLNKCLEKYPECDSVINYQVDFRELGSSGNVFVYMRGTASILGNKQLEEVYKNEEAKIKNWEEKFNVELPKQISEMRQELEKYKEIIDDVPRNFKGALKYVQRRIDS